MNTRQDISKANQLHRASDDGRSAFTLVDVLVSIAIVAVLIGLLLPSLKSVTETTRRVICASNLRQIGLGVAMYADDNSGLLAGSVFIPNSNAASRYGGRSAEAKPQDTVIVRLGSDEFVKISRVSTPWDGLGVLYPAGYLPASGVFYCPSHHGDFGFRKYRERWNQDGPELVSNYQYRGLGPHGERYLFKIEPQRSALVTDAVRSLDEFNHHVGTNTLRADLMVEWLADESRQIQTLLRTAAASSNPSKAASETVSQVWDTLDSQVRDIGR